MGKNQQRNNQINGRKEILPQGTSDLIYHYKNQIDNLFLKFCRYAYLSKGKVTPYFQIKQSYSLKYSNNANDTIKNLLNDLDGKTQYLLTTLNIQYRKFTIEQGDSRWAIGIGGVSPFGNLSVSTLHPVYGIPYIPASTLKGLMRHCWIEINCNGDNDAEEVLRLFGSSENETPKDELEHENRMGQLIFFDSYPDAKCNGTLYRDVITPLYPLYYNNFGGKPPTDDQKPVPIEFICIENMQFNIYIGSYEPLSNDEKSKLENTLSYVFSEQGIGAKTSLGYGRGKLKPV
ncbi:type III-B CRISPR module RAMP protein Cmr6 [[Clostridium] cellulosi]